MVGRGQGGLSRLVVSMVGGGEEEAAAVRGLLLPPQEEGGCVVEVVVSSEDARVYEFPTLGRLWGHCHAHPQHAALYFHNKVGRDVGRKGHHAREPCRLAPPCQQLMSLSVYPR